VLLTILLCRESIFSNIPESEDIFNKNEYEQYFDVFFSTPTFNNFEQHPYLKYIESSSVIFIMNKKIGDYVSSVSSTNQYHLLEQLNFLFHILEKEVKCSIRDVFDPLNRGYILPKLMPILLNWVSLYTDDNDEQTKFAVELKTKLIELFSAIDYPKEYAPFIEGKEDCQKENFIYNLEACFIQGLPHEEVLLKFIESLKQCELTIKKIQITAVDLSGQLTEEFEELINFNGKSIPAYSICFWTKPKETIVIGAEVEMGHQLIFPLVDTPNLEKPTVIYASRMDPNFPKGIPTWQLGRKEQQLRQAFKDLTGHPMQRGYQGDEVIEYQDEPTQKSQLTDFFIQDYEDREEDIIKNGLVLTKLDLDTLPEWDLKRILPDV